MVLTIDRNVAVVLVDQNLRVPVTGIDINLDTLLIMHNSYKTYRKWYFTKTPFDFDTNVRFKQLCHIRL